MIWKLKTEEIIFFQIVFVEIWIFLSLERSCVMLLWNQVLKGPFDTKRVFINCRSKAVFCWFGKFSWENHLFGWDRKLFLFNKIIRIFLTDFFEWKRVSFFRVRNYGARRVRKKSMENTEIWRKYGKILENTEVPDKYGKFRTLQFFSLKKRINHYPENFRIPDQSGFYFCSENYFWKTVLFLRISKIPTLSDGFSWKIDRSTWKTDTR